MLRLLSKAFLPKLKAMRWGASFRRNESGVVAIEFAMIVLPFLALLFALLNISMFYYGNLMMEHAVAETSRLIRTGQAQEQGFDETQFKTEVCNRVVILVNCMTKLKVHVDAYNSFDAVDAGNQFNNNDLDGGNLQFNMGNAEDIVLVRVFYEWTTLADFPVFDIGFTTSNMNNGSTMISAATAFRNEPFGETGS